MRLSCFVVGCDYQIVRSGTAPAYGKVSGVMVGKYPFAEIVCRKCGAAKTLMRAGLTLFPPPA